MPDCVPRVIASTVLEYIFEESSAGKSVFVSLGIIMLAYIIPAGTEINEAVRKWPMSPKP